ncbi:hypothetical protein RTS15_005100 [Salmonella enterica]|nr:hypothetical protein [Salmonella enterica]ELJ4826345.1 hypothetical protein [Salmonella enterica]
MGYRKIREGEHHFSEHIKVHLSPVQLSMLLDGIAWQYPKRTEGLACGYISVIHRRIYCYVALRKLG